MDAHRQVLCSKTQIVYALDTYNVASNARSLQEPTILNARTIVAIFIYYSLLCPSKWCKIIIIIIIMIIISPLIIKVTIKEFLTSTSCEG